MSECTCGQQAYFPAKVRSTVDGLERIITFKHGFRCSLTGGRSHGVHGVDMLWLLKGAKGVVQFMLYTDWLPPLEKELDQWGGAMFLKDCMPMPADLGYHSPTPRYEGQTIREDCPWLDGKPCYYDGSGLNAGKMFAVLLSGGEEAAWQYLTNYYHKIFDDEPVTVAATN